MDELYGRDTRCAICGEKYGEHYNDMYCDSYFERGFVPRVFVPRVFVSPRDDVGIRLPTDAAARKAVPIATGVMDYFPDAIAAVAAVSKAGGEQHNPGKPLFWDRSKSTDEADCLMRHFLERGTLDSDGQRHSAKVAWRAMALLQKELEEVSLVLSRRAPAPTGDGSETSFTFKKR